MQVDTPKLDQGTAVPAPNGAVTASPLLDIVPRVFSDLRLEDSKAGYRVVSGIDRVTARVSDTGALVLASCDGSRKLGELITELEAVYPDAAAEIRRDVFDTVRKLYRGRLLTWCGARTAGASLHVPGTFHLNRGGVVSELLERRGWRRAAAAEVAEFSLWYPRRGHRFGRFQCFEPHITTSLRCKRRLARNLQAAGCAWVGPDTCVDLAGFLERPDADQTWFVKLSNSTEGRDVFCYRDRRQVEERVAGFGNRVYVIQRGVEDPLLLKGRKTTLRVIVLAARGALWVHGEALHKTQRENYREDATEAAVQSDHSQAERRSSDDFPIFESVFDEIKDRVAAAFAAVADIFAVHPDPNRFQVFGLDFVISRSRGPMLIEVNDWPNIGYSTSNEGWETIRALRARMLTDVLDLVLENRPGRFVKVLEPFAAAAAAAGG